MISPNISQTSQSSDSQLRVLHLAGSRVSELLLQLIHADGMPRKQPEKPAVKPMCPAEVSPELFEKLAMAAKRSHIALVCRDYSLYDFRVHAETNEPYLLEAGLFWSFGKISTISRMLLADGQSLSDVALELWRGAAGRTRVACGSLLKYANL